MPNLIGNPTEFGEQLYTQNLLTNIKKFVLIGSTLLTDEVLSDKLNGLNLTYAEIQENILVEINIPYAGHDANGQAFFDCIIPYDLNLEKYIFSVGLIYEESDGTKQLADWAIVNKLYQTLQVGGTYKYLIAVTGEKGGVIFKNSDFITASELENYTAKNSMLLEDKNLDEVKEYIIGETSNLSTASIINIPTVSIVENTAIIGYSTDSNFDGLHDKTLIKLFEDENRTNLLKEYIVTSGDVANVLLSDIPANTQLWGTLQVGSDNHLSDVVEFEFTSMDKLIETPVFTVETDENDNIYKCNTKITLTSLPQTINATIDKVEFSLKQNGVEIGTVQETTDLALPITFLNNGELAVSTVYEFTITVFDTQNNIQNSTTITKTTVAVLDTWEVVDIFEDGSAVSLMPFIANADDLAGTASPTVAGAIGFGTDGATSSNITTAPGVDYIEYGLDVWNNLNQFTISFKFKFKTFGSYSMSLLSNYNCSTQVLFSIAVNSDKKIGVAYENRGISTTGYILHDELIELNREYTVSFSVDKDNHKIILFLDGVFIAELIDASITSALSQIPKFFSWESNCSSVNTQTPDAYIKQVRIFNKTINESEAMILHKECR